MRDTSGAPVQGQQCWQSARCHAHRPYVSVKPKVSTYEVSLCLTRSSYKRITSDQFCWHRVLVTIYHRRKAGEAEVSQLQSSAHAQNIVRFDICVPAYTGQLWHFTYRQVHTHEISLVGLCLAESRDDERGEWLQQL